MTVAARLFLALCLVAAACDLARAWGPHTEITTAALAVLPDDRVKTYLGDDFSRLSRDYCWMGDWQEAVRPDHYADDYLLFPGSPRHVSHMHPHVRKTYGPFFRRALQAIRTESPREAARWVGSLLHFVQDAGSPPNTTGISGTLHGKMERWVDESKISIAGYKQRLLGATDDEALAAFEERMAGLHDFSKIRAERLKPLVEKLEMRENQPLELECALETARVTADLVHTLFTLGLKEAAAPGATLEGELNDTPPLAYATVPAKIVILGTHFSTTTEAAGRYRFRNLPAGRYAVGFLATGYETQKIEDVNLIAGKTTVLSPRLKSDPVPGNVVRNPAFRLAWVSSDQPDCWIRDTVKVGRWACVPIRVPIKQACMVHVDFVPGKRVPVSLRWRTNPSSTADSQEVELDVAKLPARIEPPLLPPFEKGVLFLEVLVHTDSNMEDVCRYVAVTFVKD
jgi:hypothetical protein